MPKKKEKVATPQTKLTLGKGSRKEEIKVLLKKKMPSCFYSSVREGYEEGKIDELVDLICAVK